MVERGDDFDDVHDEDWNAPLLPPEDRIWRHPSEMGDHALHVSPEALSARRSWLAASPSRAGAWSAGIVGALLATGVVLIGGHLTHLLPSSRTPSVVGKHVVGPTIDPPSALDASTTTTLTLTENLAADAARVSMAMPTVFIDHKASGVGVVVSPNGYVLVPAGIITDTDDIGLYIDGQQLPATLVGMDSGSGLAVVRVHTAGSLDVVRFASSPALVDGSFVEFVWADGNKAQMCMGTVSGLGIPASVQTPPLLASLETLGPTDAVAVGGVVVDGAGRFIAMVTGEAGRTIWAIPGWLATVVSGELINKGQVVHGWLGLTGETVQVSPTETAVKVLSVRQGGAASKAGVKRGDIIEAVNGEPTRSMADMAGLLYTLPPYRVVVLSVDRRGHMLAANARLTPAA